MPLWHLVITCKRWLGSHISSQPGTCLTAPAMALLRPCRPPDPNTIRSPFPHAPITQQVLGLTNYSHWPKAEQLRHCARSNPAVADVSAALR
jgi:hypothetical protein